MHLFSFEEHVISVTTNCIVCNPIQPIQHEHNVKDVNETTEFFDFINSCNFFDSCEENKEIKKNVDAASILDTGGDDKLTFFHAPNLDVDIPSCNITFLKFFYLQRV